MPPPHKQKRGWRLIVLEPIRNRYHILRDRKKLFDRQKYNIELRLLQEKTTHKTPWHSHNILIISESDFW